MAYEGMELRDQMLDIGFVEQVNIYGALEVALEVSEGRELVLTTQGVGPTAILGLWDGEDIIDYREVDSLQDVIRAALQMVGARRAANSVCPRCGAGDSMDSCPACMGTGKEL